MAVPNAGPGLETLVLEPHRLAEVVPAQAVELLMEARTLVARLEARVFSAMLKSARQGDKLDGPDHLLTAEEAAAVLHVTPRWLYRHANRLPFTRRVSRKQLRFSEKTLRKWVNSRS